MDIKELEKLQKDKPIIPEATEAELGEYSVKKERDRYVEIPERLPTFNMMPLPVDEHKHIGLYESKQNLYLITAHAYNKIMERIENLESEVEQLKNTQDVSKL